MPIRGGSGKTINPEHLLKDIRNEDLIGMAINDPEPSKAMEREIISRALKEASWKYQDAAKNSR